MKSYLKRSNPKIQDVEDKINKITDVATTANLNGKINEVKNKIPSISCFAATTSLTAVENEITDVSTLDKTAEYDRKIVEIEKRLDHDHSNK